jgi:hypothetical protein
MKDVSKIELVIILDVNLFIENFYELRRSCVFCQVIDLFFWRNVPIPVIASVLKP